MYIRTLLAAASFALAGVASAQDMVVVGHPSAAALSKDQVADLFLGKSQALTPLDLSDSSPLYAAFYRKATGREVAQVHWHRAASRWPQTSSTACRTKSARTCPMARSSASAAATSAR